MFIDTNIIIEILQNDEDSKIHQEIMMHIKGEQLFISFIQLAEISDWALRENKEIHETFRDIKLMANIIPLTELICIEGAKIKRQMREYFANAKNKGIISNEEYNEKKDFGLIDGLILESARNIKQKLLTTDRHFKTVESLEDVVFIDKDDFSN